MNPETYFRPFRVKDLTHVIQDKETMVHIFIDEENGPREIDYDDMSEIAKMKDLLVTNVEVGTEITSSNHIIPCLGIHCAEEGIHTITPAKKDDGNE